MEVWKSIPGLPNHEASSIGRVRVKARRSYIPANSNRAAHSRLLPASILSRNLWGGRYFVSVDNKAIGVQRLVCLAFHGVPKPGQDNACHRDGNRKNNREDNLYWGSHSQNHHDKIAHGTMARGSKQGQSVLNETSVLEIKRRLADGEQGAVLAGEFGVARSTISAIRSGKNWSWLEIGG